MSAPFFFKKKYAAFSLLELLVSMAVLSLMMVFLFNLVTQTIRAWETGNRQVEAAQTARIGLETMAEDLQFAVGGCATALPTTLNGNMKESVIPFYSTNNATTTLGFPPAFTSPIGSGQLFVVAPRASENNELGEVGYMSLYVRDSNGYHNIPGSRYYLIRHTVPGTGGNITGNFYYDSNILPPNQATVPAWVSEGTGAITALSPLRTHLIQNCYQISFLYASNNVDGVLVFDSTWPFQNKLPAGVLVTAKVMDEKTANRIARLQPNGLTQRDLDQNSTTVVGRLLREGTVEVRRFIPFANHEQ
jgi:type II secretory pathway pseudopilin PulG